MRCLVMPNTIRPGVEQCLITNKVDIVSAWSDPECANQISRKDLASCYSASIFEIGIFLQSVLGATYKEVIRLKRQRFFKKIGISRRSEKKIKTGLSVETLEEIDLVKKRRDLSTRTLSDMSDEELNSISIRLADRLRDVIPPGKKSKKRSC
jgi:hypothetical protein